MGLGRSAETHLSGYIQPKRALIHRLPHHVGTSLGFVHRFMRVWGKMTSWGQPTKPGSVNPPKVSVQMRSCWHDLFGPWGAQLLVISCLAPCVAEGPCALFWGGGGSYLHMWSPTIVLYVPRYDCPSPASALCLPNKSSPGPDTSPGMSFLTPKIKIKYLSYRC